MIRSAASSRARRRAPWFAWAAAALVAAVIAVVVIVAASPRAAGAPGPGTIVVAPQDSRAAQAAASEDPATEEHAAAAFLAEQPTAYWLTPEADPVETVADRISALAREARDQSARVAVVVYGLPGRDCGNHSAGGLEPDAYAEWTEAIGAALRGASDVGPIVILEPDSLALAPECGNLDERVEELGAAIDALASEHTWIYLDGGHSNWHSPADMARILTAVGDLDRVRGFATNVSNYNATDDEVAYAHELAAALGGNAHAIVDTSRNGAGSDGEWCNPPRRLVGDRGGTIGDDVVDTNLWIKPPGESDGPCNGGPAAGRWWPEGAVELTRDAVSG